AIAWTLVPSSAGKARLPSNPPAPSRRNRRRETPWDRCGSSAMSRSPEIKLVRQPGNSRAQLRDRIDILQHGQRPTRVVLQTLAGIDTEVRIKRGPDILHGIGPLHGELGARAGLANYLAGAEAAAGKQGEAQVPVVPAAVPDPGRPAHLAAEE